MKIIVLLIIIFCIYFVFFTGPRNLSDYPSKVNSNYRLPYGENTSYLVLNADDKEIWSLPDFE